MNAKVSTFADILRNAEKRRQIASWRNKGWRYQPAVSHNDATAFRERQIARGLKVRQV